MGKNEKSSTVQRIRKFGLVTYLDEHEVITALKKNIDKITRYAYAVHDNEKESADNHIHILLYTYHGHSYNAVRNWFSKRQNTFAKPILDDESAVDYLTHKNEPDKVQYSDCIIQKYNFVVDNIVYDDNGYNILQAVLDKVPLRTIAKRYGRDFIYHYRAYKELSEDILFEESREEFSEQKKPVQLFFDEDIF